MPAARPPQTYWTALTLRTLPNTLLVRRNSSSHKELPALDSDFGVGVADELPGLVIDVAVGACSCQGCQGRIKAAKLQQQQQQHTLVRPGQCRKNDANDCTADSDWLLMHVHARTLYSRPVSLQPLRSHPGQTRHRVVSRPPRKRVLARFVQRQAHAVEQPRSFASRWRQQTGNRQLTPYSQFPTGPLGLGRHAHNVFKSAAGLQWLQDAPLVLPWQQVKHSALEPTQQLVGSQHRG